MTTRFTMDRFRLDGRTAIVTGAASGIGRCAALGLADAGAYIIAADINADGLETLASESEELGFPLTTVVTDIADEAMVANMARVASRVSGRTDVLVNCAGIGAPGIAENYPYELWTKVIRINTRGSFLCAKAVAPTMIARKSGSIINIVSCGAAVGWAGSVGYQASKAGLAQLSRSLAVEWGPHNIRVNSVAPGDVHSLQGGSEAAIEQESFTKFLQRIPMKRATQPVEVVGAILFLASDASSMVTGNLIATDGGYIAS